MKKPKTIGYRDVTEIFTRTRACKTFVCDCGSAVLIEKKTQEDVFYTGICKGCIRRWVFLGGYLFVDGSLFTGGKNNEPLFAGGERWA